jgi:hypothetical protein
VHDEKKSDKVGNNRKRKASSSVDEEEQSDSSESDREEGEHSEGSTNANNTENAQRAENAEDADEPPLPDEEIPPLPQEPLPQEDDGWQPVWDATYQAFYFYNRFTGLRQWENPRVPEASPAVVPPAPGVDAAPGTTTTAPPASRPAGGYDPSIHGDYDPTAWYAQPAEPGLDPAALANPAEIYAQTGHFNRFTGRWQAADVGPELHNDENKSKRQMNAFFDVDAAANSHDGRSLKAERSGKKLSRTELKQFKEKRKAKKEEKRRAWLRD